nr:hypothetical protein [Paucilactobacillus hokkaidonensis]
MVKITDDYLQNKAAFDGSNIKVPTFDQAAMKKRNIGKPSLGSFWWR